MTRRLSTTLIILFAAVLGLLALTTDGPAHAQTTTSSTTYVVQPGDSLSKIAAKNCMSWQELYELNKAVIGPDPNDLKAGTVLYVPNRCTSTQPPASGVYDPGPRMYAYGTVAGNVYTVAAGDTLYSIGQRFGLPWQVIADANGLGNNPKLYAGQKLIIPGLSQTPPPTALPPAITISGPAPNTYLNSPYSAYGSGQGLPEGNVIVRLLNGSGQVMAEQATVLQGVNTGIGGYGTWSVQFNNIIGQPNSNGTILAFNPSTGVSASVPIWFTGQ